MEARRARMQGTATSHRPRAPEAPPCPLGPPRRKAHFIKWLTLLEGANEWTSIENHCCVETEHFRLERRAGKH